MKSLDFPATGGYGFSTSDFESRMILCELTFIWPLLVPELKQKSVTLDWSLRGKLSAEG